MTNFIYENTWQENCELFKTKKVAVIPVGSNEQHGPALPTGTDWMLAEYLGREVGKKSTRLLAGRRRPRDADGRVCRRGSDRETPHDSGRRCQNR